MRQAINKYVLLVTLTLGWTKAPLFGLIIISLCGTPKLPICSTFLCAVSIPLLPKLKRELTWASKRIAPYCENLCGDRLICEYVARTYSM